MSPGISDSRWPPRRPGASAESALSQYPSYLSPRTPGPSRTVDRLLVSVTVAFGASLLLQVLVGLLLVLFAELAVPTLEPVLVVVGLLCCWSLLRLSTGGALVLAFWGQVAAVLGNLVGSSAGLPAGLALASVAAIAVMYGLARRRADLP